MPSDLVETPEVNFEEILEWEERNEKEISLGHHMIAGSAAGVAEHILMYPVDTYKTHIQASSSNTRSTILSGGIFRLYRGVNAVLIGCIPSHAAYFGVYEIGRSIFSFSKEHNPIGAAITGAACTTVHDFVLTPMDVVKQRLQLGYYSGLRDCIQTMAKEEGIYAFWRSYPTTLLMNIPVAATIVASNETFKHLFSPFTGKGHLSTFLLSGALSGALAAVVTCPIDVIKTRLQIARIPLSISGNVSLQSTFTSASTGALFVARDVLKNEGLSAFFRGAGARMLVQMPSQAVSWTAYEMIKKVLARRCADY